MPPKFRSDDGRNIIISPLAYCGEKDLLEYSNLSHHPIIPCNLCGSQENLQRQNIKAMLSSWDANTPRRFENIFKSIKNISLSQLADTTAFDFTNLSIDRAKVKDAYEFSSETDSSTNIDEPLYIDATRIDATRIDVTLI